MKLTAFLLAVCLLLCGCQSREISESLVTSAAAAAAVTDAAKTTSAKVTTTVVTTSVRTTSVTTAATTAAAVIPPEQILLDEMSLEEKVGQLFLLPVTTPTLSASESDLFDNIKPCGYIFFADAISSLDQFRTLITELYDAAWIKPFFSVDQEGGRVRRLKSNDSFTVSDIPPMKSVGAANAPAYAYDVGMVTASELRVFGFNMNFAPVADVYSNPNNKVIGDRAFSSDPATVAALSSAFADGLISRGVIPVAKHFPGHGDTTNDSHYGYAVSDKSLEALYETELIPFMELIGRDIPAIMAAHVSLPQITGDSTPCTMSGTIITGFLREKLGFDGVVITDALNMGAIANHYTAEESAINAILAGCDILLMPSDPQLAYESVLDAVQNGIISEDRVNESVLRILKLKLQYDIEDRLSFANPALLNCNLHQQLLSYT